MVTALQSAITLLGTLAAVGLGWFLNERSRKSREDRAAIGRALTTLLFFRKRLAGIKFLAAQISSVTPPMSRSQIQVLFHQMLPRFATMDKEYLNAVNYLAGVNPLLAMTVHTAGLRANYDLPSVPAGTEINQVMDDISEKMLDPAMLDEAIEWLAELHGRKTLKRIREELEAQNNPDPEFEDMMQRIIPFDHSPSRSSS